VPLVFPQILASLLALFVALSLCGYGLRVAALLHRAPGASGRLDSVAGTYAALMLLSAFLAIRSGLNAPWIERGLLVVLTPGFFSMIRWVRGLGADRVKFGPWVLLVMFGIGVEVLYAALPLYRFDQWTYHLVVAKWVALDGNLGLPVVNDSIFFTGNYEFLGLLARAVSSSDTFQQGFHNSLSLLLIVVPSMIFFLGFNPLGKERFGLNIVVLAAAFALWVVFASGDHEALISSKPDYIIMMSALVCLAFVAFGSQMVSPLLVGFLLVGSLAYKITWLHFALCSPVIAISCYLEWKKGHGGLTGLLWLVCGGALAVPVLLPWMIKNWYYFENPLHPAQTPFWQSSIWGPRFDEYWRGIASKPEGLKNFGLNFFGILKSLPGRWWLFLTGVILILMSRFWRSRNSQLTDDVKGALSVSWWGLLACFCVYLASWGLFYKAQIYNRFVSPFFSFSILLICWMVWTAASRRVAMVILLMPFFAESQLEVSLGKIWRATTHDWESFATSIDGPIEKVPQMLKLAEDRKVRFPGASYAEATILSDFVFGFYGPAAVWQAADRLTYWQLERVGVDPEDGDGLEFMRIMNIRYVWVVEPDRFMMAPPALQKVLPRLTRIPSDVGTLFVRDP
jgi:hypothetical protein